MRHHSPPSPGHSRQSHASARAVSGDAPSRAHNAIHAIEVTHPPSSCPITVGHEPSGSCAPFRKRTASLPRRALRSSAFVPEIASKLQLVGSISLFDPARNPQPPSLFCAASNAGSETWRRKELSIRATLLIKPQLPAGLVFACRGARRFALIQISLSPRKPRISLSLLETAKRAGALPLLQQFSHLLCIPPIATGKLLKSVNCGLPELLQMLRANF